MAADETHELRLAVNALTQVCGELVLELRAIREAMQATPTGLLAPALPALPATQPAPAEPVTEAAAQPVGGATRRSRRSRTRKSASAPQPTPELEQSGRVWLQTQGARVLRTGGPHEEAMAPVALQFGDYYEDLRALHQCIRRSHKLGRQVQFSLGKATAERVSRCLSFARTLEQEALLLDVEYDEQTKVLTASPSADSRVQRFHDGLWFELYVTGKARQLAQDMGLLADLSVNMEIRTPKGLTREIDVLLWVRDAPVLVECTTGAYTNHAKRLHGLAGELGLPTERAMLVLLSAPPKASELGANLGITVTDRPRFLKYLRGLLSTPPAPTTTPSVATADKDRIMPGHLAAYLSKRNLGPFPEVRGDALRAICKFRGVFGSGAKVSDVKAALKKVLPTASEVQIRDIVRALLEGGAFLDAKGAPVASPNVAIHALKSKDPTALETLCVQAYARVILESDPHWLDGPTGRSEFIQVVGRRAPKQAVIEALRAQLTA